MIPKLHPNHTPTTHQPVGADFKTDDSNTVVVGFIGVVLDRDESVIVHVELALFAANLLAVLHTQ
jgi:hypothetical protein